MAENEEVQVGVPDDVAVDLWSLDGGLSNGYRYKRCLDFTFEKERYTPYPTLKTRFLISITMVKPTIPRMVDFYINGVHVHRGMADKVTETTVGNMKVLEIYSRGFGCCLYTGQVRPDTYPSMSLNKLMNMGSFQYLTWEKDNTLVTNLTVTELDDLWSAATKLCFRLYQNHPYCISPGTIRFTPNPEAKSHVMSWKDKRIISYENTTDVSKVITGIRMRDPTGYYGNPDYYYNGTNFYLRVGFWREKIMACDKEWSDNPKAGVEFLTRSTHRRMRQYYITYKGYNNEEIGDFISFAGLPLSGMPTLTNVTISYVKVTCDENSLHLTTKLGIYIDPYNNDGI